MLVTCLKCKKPVFVSSSVLGSGEATVPCNACQASLVISESGSVRIDEVQAAIPPSPPPDEMVTVSPTAAGGEPVLGIGSAGQAENFTRGNGEWKPVSVAAPDVEPEETTVDMGMQDLAPSPEEATTPDVMAAAAAISAPSQDEVPTAPPIPMSAPPVLKPVSAPPSMPSDEIVTVPSAPAAAPAAIALPAAPPPETPAAPPAEMPDASAPAAPVALAPEPPAAPVAAPMPATPLPEFSPADEPAPASEPPAAEMPAAEMPAALPATDEVAPAQAADAPALDSATATPGEYQIVAQVKPTAPTLPVDPVPPEPAPERIEQTHDAVVDVSQRTDDPKTGPVRDMPWKVQPVAAADTPVAETPEHEGVAEPAPSGPPAEEAPVESWTVAAGGTASLTDSMPPVPMDGAGGRSGTIKLDEKMFADESRRSLRLPMAAAAVLLLAGGGLWAAEIVRIPGVPVPAGIRGLLVTDADDKAPTPGPAVAVAMPQPEPSAAPAVEPQPEPAPEPMDEPDPDAGDPEVDTADEPDATLVDGEPRRPGSKRRKRGPRGVRGGRGTDTVATDSAAIPVSTVRPVEPVVAKPAGESEAMLHYKQGNLFLKEKKVALAIEEFKKSLAKNSRHGLAYRSLGVAYMLLGREKSAVSAYERFVALEPGHKDAGKVQQIINDYYKRNPK